MINTNSEGEIRVCIVAATLVTHDDDDGDCDGDGVSVLVFSLCTCSRIGMMLT